MDPNSTPDITPELLQQHPLLAVLMFVFVLFLLAALAGVITSWVFLAIAWWKKGRLLSVAQWTPRPWGLADIVLTGIVVVVLQILLTALASPLLQIDLKSLDSSQGIPLPLAAVISAGYLLSVLLVTLWIVLRYRAAPAVLGWSTENLHRLLFIGLIAGLATLPFVLALSAAVSIGMDTEYDHPILQAMQADGTVASYALALFSAVLVAPVAEEFLFRVLIQGWLQSIPFVNTITILLGRVDVGDRIAPIPVANEPWSQHFDAQLPSSSLSEPYATPHAGMPLGQQSIASAPPESQSAQGCVPPIWPSFVAGTLFGLAHWEYGLSFVPLIVLGIVLGLLYRATKSIWPCVMVHFMLNASSMFALGVAVYAKSVAGN